MRRSSAGHRTRRPIKGMVSFRRAGLTIATIALALWACGAPGRASTTDTLVIRGQSQSLRLYGARGGRPVVVSSGDGGWLHLGPHVAQMLSAHGFFVVGFDVRAYLSSFTSGRTVLEPEREPADYRQLAEFAGRGADRRPILIGVSEGAGLSVMAAADPATKAAIAGVVALGLPERNELGWRWSDAVIYFTHGVPKEPTFQSSTLIDRVAPMPVALIHSTHDEFVPVDEVRRIYDVAREPKRLWTITAADHRFSDRLAEFDSRLLEAIAWIDGR